jgi:hypothetical protein
LQYKAFEFQLICELAPPFGTFHSIGFGLPFEFLVFKQQLAAVLVEIGLLCA